MHIHTYMRSRRVGGYNYSVGTNSWQQDRDSGMKKAQGAGAGSDTKGGGERLKGGGEKGGVLFVRAFYFIKGLLQRFSLSQSRVGSPSLSHPHARPPRLFSRVVYLCSLSLCFCSRTLRELH